MLFASLRRFFGIAKAKRRKNASRARLALECLEERTTPSTIIVNTISDSSTHAGTSLREAIGVANVDAANGQSDTITFAGRLAWQTIKLTKGPLVLSGAGSGTITIDASSLKSLAISGGGKVQVFVIDSGVNADFNKLIIENGSTGTGNIASDAGGGIANSGFLTVTNSTITDNFAATGGGIANLASGTMTLRHSTVIENSASTGDGGIANAGTMTVLNSTITQNTVVGNPSVTSANGGGVGNSGTMTISDTLIANNAAGRSAGIGNAGTMTVTDSTVAGNHASDYNGGVGNTGTLTVVNATIVHNSARKNGGLGNGGNLTLLNTIVDNNYADSAPDVQAGRHFIAGGHNLIGSSAGLGGSGMFNHDSRGDLVGFYPGLSALANYGGATETFSLLPRSRALFAGGPATTLTAGIPDTMETSTTVANGSVFSSTALPLLTTGWYFIIQIGGEEMAVTALTPGTGTTATLTVVRGVNFTTVASHAASDYVYLVSDQRGITAPFFSSSATPSIGAYQSQGFIHITSNPVSHSVIAGSATRFTASVAADPTARVQWQSLAPGSVTWTDLTNGGAYSGTNTKILTVIGSHSLNGYRYRAVFSNSADTVVTTSARLTVY
jgi:hypothetical protein